MTANQLGATDGIHDSMNGQRVLMILLGLFAGLALVLATIGIYGVMSYTVTQRTREIGIRVALGAGTGEILGLVLGESLRLSLVAVVLGVGAAILGGKALEAQLYGVAATDPVTLIAVSLAILAVCLVASFLPARRASKVDPMVALRYE
jgi:putative ABC transport system permease protein